MAIQPKLTAQRSLSRKISFPQSPSPENSFSQKVPFSKSPFPKKPLYGKVPGQKVPFSKGPFTKMSISLKNTLSQEVPLSRNYMLLLSPHVPLISTLFSNFLPKKGKE